MLAVQKTEYIKSFISYESSLHSWLFEALNECKQRFPMSDLCDAHFDELFFCQIEKILARNVVFLEF